MFMVYGAQALWNYACHTARVHRLTQSHNINTFSYSHNKSHRLSLKYSRKYIIIEIQQGAKYFGKYWWALFAKQVRKWLANPMNLIFTANHFRIWVAKPFNCVAICDAKQVILHLAQSHKYRVPVHKIIWLSHTVTPAYRHIHNHINTLSYEAWVTGRYLTVARIQQHNVMQSCIWLLLGYSNIM